MEPLERFEVVNDPPALLEKLGGLHDVRILAFSVNVETRTTRLLIDDALFNFEGHPDYVALPCEFEFVDVRQFRSNVELSEGLRIHSTDVASHLHQFKCSIALNRGGNWREGKSTHSIEITFKELRVARLRELLDALGRIRFP